LVSLINIIVSAMVAIFSDYCLRVLYLARTTFHTTKNQSRSNKLRIVYKGRKQLSIQGVHRKSADNISNVAKEVIKIYTNIIDGLATARFELLKKKKKVFGKLV